MELTHRAKMWKYISRVSKVVDKKETKKAPKAAHDTKEYEKTRTSKFSTKWQVGRPWLKSIGWRDCGGRGGGFNFWASERDHS